MNTPTTVARFDRETAPLDPTIEQLIRDAEASTAPLSWFTGATDMYRKLLFVRGSLAFGRAFAYGVGWTPAQVDMIAALDVSGLQAPASRPTTASSRAMRHGLYLVGAREPGQRATAADRRDREVARSCALWGYTSAGQAVQS